MYGGDSMPNANSFKQMVQEAIADEIGAVAMYATMANMVQDIALKTLILSIAGDEYGHAKTWIAIYLLDD
jgi:rubrerythrin